MVKLSKEQQIAADYNTPEDVLKKLADSKYKILQEGIISSRDKEILAAIASNPNTPPEVLLNLFPDYIDRVLYNPCFELLLLENPNFLGELLQRLYEGNQDFYYGEFANFLCSEKLPDFFWNYVLNRSEIHIRAFIARSFKIEIPLLEKFAADNNAKVRSGVICNPDLPISILEKLARDKSVDVRRQIAMSSYIDKEILEQLARDKSEEVRLEIAKNRNIDREILEQLAGDTSAKVRCQVAKNRNVHFRSLS